MHNYRYSFPISDEYKHIFLFAWREVATYVMKPFCNTSEAVVIYTLTEAII